MRLIKSLGFILLTLAGVAASAQTFEVDGINYNVLSEAEGTVEVTSGDYSGDVVIPAEVTYDGSTYSVTTIGGYAFYSCDALTSIEMPSVTTIGGSAFRSCRALTSVEMPEATTISDWAFALCRSLVSVSMPSVITISEEAFSDCSALTSVSIPASCTSIGDEVFLGCSVLKEITVDEDNRHYSSYDGVLYDKKRNTLLICPCGKISIDIPVTVTKISDKAFNDCELLASVSMRSVITIGDMAFWGCTSLESVSMPSVATIGFAAFSECSSLASVSIPASCTSIGDDVFVYCSALEEITVDEDNRYYSSYDGVLYDKDKSNLVCCPGGKISIDTPITVTTIDDKACYYCKSLASVSMPSVTTIGESAFGGCTSLASVDMQSVMTIDDFAFSGCTSLVSVDTPLATTIGESAFSGCTSLVSVNIPLVTTINGFTFSLCPSLLSVNMPYVTTIGNYAFNECSALTSVEIPVTVTKIDYGAFIGCNALTSVYCHWQEPLECEPGFVYDVFMNATLYVPTGTVDAYRSVKPWSDFANIVEARYSGIVDTPDSEVTVKVIDGAIIIGCSDSTASAPVVEVYSAGGVCVYRGTDSSIGGLPRGVYVVRVGSTVQKVAL